MINIISTENKIVDSASTYIGYGVQVTKKLFNELPNGGGSKTDIPSIQWYILVGGFWTLQCQIISLYGNYGLHIHLSEHLQ